jgi:hypothetical protein
MVWLLCVKHGFEHAYKEYIQPSHKKYLFNNFLSDFIEHVHCILNRKFLSRGASKMANKCAGLKRDELESGKAVIQSSADS